MFCLTINAHRKKLLWYSFCQALEKTKLELWAAAISLKAAPNICQSQEVQQFFSFCINLSFLWSTKETQLMKLCWQPKRKKKACDMAVLLQPQMWTFPCLLHDEVLSLLHHEGFDRLFAVYIEALSFGQKRAWDTGAPFVEHRERYAPRERSSAEK
jgi:hypothetical protein